MKDVFIFDQMGIDTDGQVIGEHKATGYVPLCFDHFKRMSLPVSEDMFRA